MDNLILITHKKRKITLPEGWDLNNLQIGIPITNRENEKLALVKCGDTILPSADYGPTCRKNAQGYSYPDRTKDKERRHVASVEVHPFGNQNAPTVTVDITRLCYPRVYVAPYDIEVTLTVNSNGELFILANMSPDQKANHLKDAVNMMIEIFGKCFLYSNSLIIALPKVITRYNWVLLPPGTKPSTVIQQRGAATGKAVPGPDIKRIKYLESLPTKEIGQGKNGYAGYWAFVFQHCCILESPQYGNATYFVPALDWEILSQKTKAELLGTGMVLAKIIHSASWENAVSMEYNRLEVAPGK